MTRITVTDRQGETREIDAEDGISLMQTLRDNDFEDILATCGGCCSCATCHVYCDPAYMDKMPPITEDENDLLDGSLHRRENSRLSCQITMSSELEGLSLVIPEGD
ncbi:MULTISPECIES: 2Fe-2S iron-sulfur cluster-binding protein [Paracoccus]|uniref:2Fe-2S iron-sulfur cluster-binding protein n=1 Tax=Paracoccus TaxID=265 RepID=UPI00049192F8|nr:MULTISPECIES: 2Fe-2S iron-sulfur cluster-binding protein [Paracoccus]